MEERVGGLSGPPMVFAGMLLSLCTSSITPSSRPGRILTVNRPGERRYLEVECQGTPAAVHNTPGVSACSAPSPQAD